MKNKYKYIKEYNRYNIVQINLKFNKNTDQEIIAFIESLENKQSFFKEIIKKELTERNK